MGKSRTIQLVKDNQPFPSKSEVMEKVKRYTIGDGRM